MALNTARGIKKSECDHIMIKFSYGYSLVEGLLACIFYSNMERTWAPKVGNTVPRMVSSQ